MASKGSRGLVAAGGVSWAHRRLSELLEPNLIGSLWMDGAAPTGAPFDKRAPLHAQASGPASFDGWAHLVTCDICTGYALISSCSICMSYPL